MNIGRTVFSQLIEHLPNNDFQIWIAISVYVLVAIVRKRLGLDKSLYQTLQILSVTVFEKEPILQVFHTSDSGSDFLVAPNQLALFDF